ncbi:MAG: DUF58 domain-containing protein [Planctomycetes bacterium]|nr:DUF58 domain-containing protein [Planctomycetota bacterium]
MRRFLDPQAVSRLGPLEIVARSVVEGSISGLHKSPFHGFSVEFTEYREYSPGDDLRTFDWKAYARTDRTYVKLFEEETNLKAHVLLDASRSMEYRSGGAQLSKLDCARYLAASLAYLLVRQRDSVGLVVLGGGIQRWIPPRGGAGHLHDLLGALEEVRTADATGLAPSLHRLADGIKTRGLVILLSDLLDDPAAVRGALRHFRHNRHEVVVLHVLDPAELRFPFTGLCNFRDMETGQRVELQPQVFREEYLAAMEGFTSGYRRFASESAMDYEVVDTAVPFDRWLAGYLHRRMARD